MNGQKDEPKGENYIPLGINACGIINTFFTFQVVKIPATTHILGKNYKIPDFSLTFLAFKISLTNLQNSDFSLTLKKNQCSLTFPVPVATLSAALLCQGFTAQSTANVMSSRSVTH